MPRTGTSTIIDAARLICRMVGQYGAWDLEASTSPAFRLAVDALVVACNAFEAADDYPGEIDTTTPSGPEDL
jgi:hypothetical protein